MHAWYTISTGPLNPAVGVKVYVPSAAMVIVPWADVGPVTKLAVKLAPEVLLSLLNNAPVAEVPAATLV